MSYEKKIKLTGSDRKGEAVQMGFKAKTAASEAELKAISALSYMGCTGYTLVTETVFSSAQAVTVNALVENDQDFKAILTFKGIEGNFKVVWPCPKINIEGGIIVRWGTDQAQVPMTKISGEEGLDGSEIAALVATATGDATVIFKSGHLYKRP